MLPPRSEGESIFPREGGRRWGKQRPHPHLERIAGAFGTRGTRSCFAGSPPDSAGRYALPPPESFERCSRGLASPQRERGLRGQLITPAELHPPPHPRARGDGQRSRLEIAVE